MVLLAAGLISLFGMLMGHRRAGITRTVFVTKLPTVECTIAALRSTPCVTAVAHNAIKPRVDWSLSKNGVSRTETPGYEGSVPALGFASNDASPGGAS
jgi:hypothetical protein